MTADDLRSLQASLKEHYREFPDAPLITLRAQGRLAAGLSCKIETGKALITAGGCIQLREAMDSAPARVTCFSRR